MTEQSAQHPRGWQWVAMLVAAILVLLLTCAFSMLWGGAIGFVLGRASAPRGPYAPALPERQIPPIPEPLPMPPLDAPRPYLGVTFQMTEAGALIRQVVVGSPADVAGVEVGEIITHVDGQRITEARPLDQVILAYSPGDRIGLTLLRNSQERQVRVRLGSRMPMEMPRQENPFELLPGGSG